MSKNEIKIKHMFKSKEIFFPCMHVIKSRRDLFLRSCNDNIVLFDTKRSNFNFKKEKN